MSDNFNSMCKSCFSSVFLGVIFWHLKNNAKRLVMDTQYSLYIHLKFSNSSIYMYLEIDIHFYPFLCIVRFSNIINIIYIYIYSVLYLSTFTFYTFSFIYIYIYAYIYKIYMYIYIYIYIDRERERDICMHLFMSNIKKKSIIERNFVLVALKYFNST